MKRPLRLLLGVGTFCAALVSGATAAELAWVELFTSGSPAMAAKFYETTFGWTAERSGAGDWAPVVLSRGGKPVAGVVHRAGDQLAATRSRWIGFFTASDLTAVEAAALAAGGGVFESDHVGATPTETRRLLVDTTGAVFGVSIRSGGDETRLRGFWPVMLARDTPGAAKFYRAVLGGEVTPESRTPMFPGDFRLEADGRVWAGVQPAGVGGRGGWLILIGVADIDATVKTARKEGARILREPSIDLIGGRVAVLADPFGGVFGLYESIPLGSGAAMSGGAGAGAKAAVYEVEEITR